MKVAKVGPTKSFLLNDLSRIKIKNKIRSFFSFFKVFYGEDLIERNVENLYTLLIYSNLPVLFSKK